MPQRKIPAHGRPGHFDAATGAAFPVGLEPKRWRVFERWPSLVRGVPPNLAQCRLGAGLQMLQMLQCRSEIAFVVLEAELLALVGTPNSAVVPYSDGQGQVVQLHFEALPSAASLAEWQEGNTTTWDV